MVYLYRLRHSYLFRRHLFLLYFGWRNQWHLQLWILLKQFSFHSLPTCFVKLFLRTLIPYPVTFLLQCFLLFLLLYCFFRILCVVAFRITIRIYNIFTEIYNFLGFAVIFFLLLYLWYDFDEGRSYFVHIFWSKWKNISIFISPSMYWCLNCYCLFNVEKILSKPSQCIWLNFFSHSAIFNPKPRNNLSHFRSYQGS